MDNQPNFPAKGEAHQEWQKYEQEDEINLIDYIRVIWRRKIAILLIFLGILLITLLITLTTPKIYQSSALIIPAKTSGQNIVLNQEASDQSIENIGTIITVLNQEAMLQELAQKLNLPESSALSLANEFKVVQNNNFWEVRGMSQTPEQAKKIVDVISNFIINRENAIASRFRLDLEAETVLLQNEVDKNATNIANLDKKIVASEKTTSPAQGYIVASYISTRQNAEFRGDELQKELYDKQQELNFQIQESKIEIPAVLSLQPISSNKISNLAISAIIGLFVGIFYAFIAEYWQKNKKKI